jgi:plastocyanin
MLKIKGMKKLYTLILLFITPSFSVNAENFLITIDGFSYTPSVLTAQPGDVITIEASAMHPLSQVSETTWNANGTEQLVGGFGTETSDYSFTLTNTEDVFFVCLAHVSAGMKGKIEVENTTSVEDAARISSLKVFPNPVKNGSMTIAAPEQMDGQQLELYNTNGQLVRTIGLSGLQMELNLKLQSGIYTAVLVAEQKAVLRKRLVFIN